MDMTNRNIKVSFTDSSNAYTIVLSEGLDNYGRIQVNVVDNSKKKDDNNTIITIEFSDIILWAASL